MNELRLENVNSRGYGIIGKMVMEDKNLTIEAKAIYSYFCSFAGAGNTAFPSIQKICNDLGIGEERLRKHLGKLKEADYIRVEQIKENGKFAKNIYTLVSNPNPSFTHIENQSSNKPTLEIPSTENLGTNNNSIKNNNNKINSIKNQSVSLEDTKIQDKQNYEEQNKEQTDRLTDIFNNSQIELYDEKRKLFLKTVIQDLYIKSDMPFKLKMGLSQSQIRERLDSLKLEHIDRALSKTINAKVDKNPQLYFSKCLLTAIVESGIDDLAEEAI